MQRLFGWNHSRILKFPLYSTLYYSQSRLEVPRSSSSGLEYKHLMAESPKIGEVHTLSISEMELPAGKKPRLIGKKGAKDNKRAKRLLKKQNNLPELCSSEDVLWRDVIALLGKDVVDKALDDGTAFDSPFEYHQVVEVEVSSLCSSGEAIARSTDEKHPWAIVVPFSLPGERVRARIYRNARLHSFADLVEVVRPNPELRDDNRVQCKYFGACAGCQYQMLSYETQLDIKRDVVVRAYKNFSDLSETSIPPILPTIGSPLQFNYRTKLTPHFEAPPKAVRARKPNPDEEEVRPDWLSIGFNRAGTSKTMDIEDCPIATPVINNALGHARKDITKNIHTYTKGVSLLFRDSLVITASTEPEQDTDNDLSNAADKHICITDPKATVREKVGDWIFEYNASSFFQNNNSVLVPLTNYVRDAIFPPSVPTDPGSLSPTHLVDAYCGAGLFAITLSPHFSTVAGIELSAESIKFAKRNAELNEIPSERCTFRAGDAAAIFATVTEFPPDKTVLLIDPPRKGCSDNFIQQLLAFRCKTVVYVSCNVHTQARDVGIILKATENEEPGRKYILESLRGFDLFPQTAHVESVAILRLV